MRVRDIEVNRNWYVSPYLVRNGYDAQALRLIRNECLDGLTGDPTPVTQGQQADWWNLVKDDPAHISYLYFTPGDGLVGFSHIHFRNGYQWPSLGVRPEFRGRGFGREIVEHTMIACGGPARGHILVDNVQIQRIDFSLGWFITGEIEKEGRRMYEVSYPWPPPFLVKP